MKTYVIGDIHGCFTALQAVVEAAEVRSGDRLVTLGDYIDRGPQTREVLQWLCDRYAGGNLVPLLGNHELMMRAARDEPKSYDFWIAYGGKETLRSYGLSDDESALNQLPEAHWHFMDVDCRQWYETPTHIFVHAGLHPDFPLDQQYEFVLFWDRFLKPPPHHSGKTMVCGHTPQPEGIPVNHGHAICLDTGAYLEDGWLTCLEVETNDYWQANQSGDVRCGHLSAPEG